MKKLGIFILLCILTFGIVTVGIAQILFEDNFDKVNESEKKWVSLWGDWEFKDDEYHQKSGDSNCMSIITDDYWDEDWVDYTYEVRGKKTGGAEGFLIMFRCQGTMVDRGHVLREHPPRMQGQAQLEYWWNLGGWGNARSQVEAWGGGKAGAHSDHTIDTNKWYTIKIVNTAAGYTLFLNDEEVADIDDNTRDGVGRVGVATWATMAIYDDVLVYGPGGPLPVDPKGKVATAWGFLKAGR